LHEVESITISSLSDSDARAIGELLVRVWPKDNRPLDYRIDQLFQRKIYNSGKQSQDPRSLIIRSGSRIMAHAAVMPRTVGTSQGDLTLLALAHVCTAPDTRGQRLGQRIMQAVFALVDDGTFPFSLFQTTEQVKPFYLQLGACLAENSFVDSTNPKNLKSPFQDPVIMRYPDGEGWPEGTIDLRGPGY
jgi:predicted GNAT family N-acyltransferase